jgi:hypothetical protein
MKKQPATYILEAVTQSGKICETHPTYESAVQRIEQLAGEGFVEMPLLFKELADGSQRLVRMDGKPLQWHRLPDDQPIMEDAIPLSEEVLNLPPPVEITQPPELPELLDWEEEVEKED